MKTLKKALALLLVLAMSLSLMSVAAFADDEIIDEPATVEEPAAEEITAVEEAVAEAVATASEALETLASLSTDDAAPAEEVDASTEAIEAAAAENDLDALSAIVEAAAESAKADAETAVAAAEKTQTASETLTQQIEDNAFESVADETVFEAVDEESGEVYETTSGQVLVETAQAAANAAVAAAQNAETASENAANAADAAQYALENADEPATEEQQQVVDTAKEAAADAADKAETAKAAAAEVEAVIETATATAEEAAEIVAKAADAAKDAAAAANNAAVAAKDAADTIAVIRNVDETHTEDEVSAAKSVVAEKVERAVELAKVADEKAAIAKEAAERAKDVTLSGEEKAQAIKEAAAAAQEATVAANEAADAASEAADAAYSLAEHKGWPFYSKIVTTKGVIVTARAQAGVFPKGTELTVADMTAEQAAEQMDVAASDVVTAVDINFWFEGRKIQPDTSVGLVDVTITDPNAEAVPTAVKTVKDGVTETLAVEVEDGVAMFEAEHFTVYATVQASSVAKIAIAYANTVVASNDGYSYYDTLADAIADAKNGATITMLQSGKSTGSIDNGKTFTIDLNGQTLLLGSIKSGFVTVTDSADTKGKITNSVYVYGSSDSNKSAGLYNKFTLDSSATIENRYGIVIWHDNNKAYGSQVVINGTVKGNIFVSGNIHEGNSVLDVKGTVNATGLSNVGIALNGYMIVNVYDGADIRSEKGGNGTGIEVRSGTLNVTGGTITGVGTYGFTPNSSGTTSTGVGIAVAQHTTANNIQVNVSGNATKVNGTVAMALANPQQNSDGTLNVNVAGGTFTATGDTAIYTALNAGETRVNEFITGGTFKVKTAYGLQKVLDYTKEDATGVTIELLDNITINAYIKVIKSITINGGDHKITAQSGASRMLRIGSDNVTVNLNHIRFDGNSVAERAVQVDSDKSNVTLNIDSCDMRNISYYTVNVCGGVTGLDLNIKNSYIAGWGAINLWGNTYDVSISDTELVGTNPFSGGSNAFGVVVLEGDTTGQTDLHVENCNVELDNCIITAIENGTMWQWAILFNNPSAHNTVTLKGNGTRVTYPGRYYYTDSTLTAIADMLCRNENETNSLIIEGGTYSKYDSEGDKLSDYVASGYKEVANSDDTWTVYPIVAHAAVTETCTAAGNSAYWSVNNTKYYSNAACESEIEADSWVIPATGHSWGAWTVVTPATYTSTGLEQRVCAHDASHVETRTIPQLVSDDSDDDDDTPVTTTPQQTTTIEEEATPLAALPENLAEVTVAVVDAETGETVEVAVSELPNVFVDVAEDSYARDAIAYAAALGLMNGVGSNADGEATFAPTAATTGDMLATILYRATSGETTSGENWAEAATAWAADNNLAEGMGIEELSQLEVVSREQMVTVMYRVAEARGFDVSFANDLVKFNDADELSDYARVAMEWAVSVGLIKGTSKTTLSPTDDVTREQIALILMRFNELTKDVV